MRTLVLLALPFLLPAQEISPANISPEKEAVLGAGLAKEYQRRMTVVENDAVVSYLHGLTARLRASLPEGPPEFRVSLVANEPDGPLRAPVALPGGYLFVPARMIAEAQDEAAFARQMAHAMAHIAQRHGFKSSPGTIPLFWVNGIDGPVGANVMLPMAVRASQEGWETEANALAEQMMRDFVPSDEFAAAQSAVRALTPPRKPPSLRREGEPVR